MNKTTENKDLDAAQAPVKSDKKEYQAPKCEQHKPLDHVRVWTRKSLPGTGIL